MRPSAGARTGARAVLLAACISALGCQATAPAAGDEIHVGTGGDDAGAGTAAAPFRTLARAQAAVRARIAAGLLRPLTVVVQGGVYRLAEPLSYSAADSGRPGCPVIWRAAEGQDVVLSGGRRIAGWRAAGGGRFEAALPEVAAGTWWFRHLTVGDRRAVRARWPDDDGVLHIRTVEDGVTRFTFDRPLPAFDAAGTELVVYENWSITRGRVVANDRAALRTATPMGWIGHGDATTASPGKPAFLEHAAAFLDAPGEWFADGRTGVLTLLPRQGEDPSGATEVVAPVLEQLLRIAGTRTAPVRHLHFVGLRFEHTRFPLPEAGYREIQAAHYGTELKAPTSVQPVAIECVHAEDCRFERCRLAHIGASGIGFGPGCRRNEVVGCTVEDVGGTGLVVGWRGAGELAGGREGALDADWADPDDAPAGNRITDCRVRRCGADSRGAVGIFVAFARDTLVSHNLVHEMPYTGISLGYRWNTSPTSQQRCIVENNHIHDVMQVLADGGGVYTLGLQPGTVLRGNHIHDVHRSAFAHGGAPNNGFFIDQGSKGYVFERNVVHGVSGAPVRFNQSRREWHEWRDNLLGDEAAQGPVATEIRAQAGPRAPHLRR